MAAEPESDIDAVEAPSLDVSFEPYSRLLKMLVPSSSGVVVHDGFCNLIWASDEWHGEGEAVIQDAISNALSQTADYPGIVRTMNEDHAVYSFAVRGEPPELLGVVSLVVRLSSSQTEARPLQYVQPLVQPALECLRRELSLRSKLGSREQDLLVRERELALMLQMSARQTTPAGHADEFDLILKTGLEHMSCALAALWVPDKKIALTLTRSGQPMSPEALQRAQQHLMAWMQLQQRTIVVNRIGKTAGQQMAPYKILACPLRHPSGKVIGVLALFNPPSAQDFDPRQTLIAELLAKKSTLIIQAHYDMSTGLMTRPAFELQALALPASAGTADSHVIIYLDIDRLHVINETFGMHVGDEVIARVAECMAKFLPRGALSARISGDRLAALVPNADMGTAEAVAEKIRAAITAIQPQAGQDALDVSASLGIAPIGRGDNALAHALATAEIACKAAKERGRDRVEVFQDSDHGIIRRHTEILVVGQVREALANDKFRLDAQPILPLRGGIGRPRFELLIRMLGDRREIIAPGKFLLAAERHQLMPAIDRWVVRRACEVLGSHDQAKAEELARFAINLSGQSLQDESFLEFVTEQIRVCKLPGNVLCFELTESATIGSLANAQKFMRTLQDLGCQFALDDFGTGVSSIGYLKDLSIDYLKIDGCFVRDALTNSRSETMIKAIAQMAKVMCIKTIAEHVETDGLRARMEEVGVDYGQGFAMGKAQPLEALLKEHAVYEATVSSWDVSDKPANDARATAG